MIHSVWYFPVGERAVACLSLREGAWPSLFLFVRGHSPACVCFVCGHLPVCDCARARSRLCWCAGICPFLLVGEWLPIFDCMFV